MNMKIKKGRQTLTSKIAYLAGFFDGEGCVRIKKAGKNKNSYSVIAHVTNSNKDILESFQWCFGGQIRKQERTPNKDIYNYYITCAEAVDMLQILFCFLREKKTQAELAIRFHETKELLSPEIKERYYIKMRELKKKDQIFTEVIGNIYENPELLEVEKCMD